MFPIFSSIDREIYATIMSSGKGLQANPNIALNSSELVPFVRLISGTGDGLIMQSTIDLPIYADPLKLNVDKNGTLQSIRNAPSIYGNRYVSGMLGYNWKLEPVFPFNTPLTGDLVLRPSPLITDLEVKEGKDQISRHAKVVIKCFSLAQAEMIQEYCMEPGHSLLIEYGWNSDKAEAQLISLTDSSIPATPLSSDEISFQAANENINASILDEKRIKSGGDYDSFFGFIVGGDMTSEGDTYILTINLRGMPGLPSYIQLHQNINKIKEEKDANGKVIKRVVTDLPEAPPYAQTDIENTQYNLQNMGLRRWKWMFNKLPAQRQTFEVQELINNITNSVTSGVGWWDLVNFDYTVSNSVFEFANDNWLESLKTKVGLEKEFTAGGVPIEKERLVSEHRYIRFSKAIEILNRNNGLMSYKIGTKTIKVRIATTGFIGAFPGIFSTKPSKLIIPGLIPDFQKYYLNTSTVTANDVINSPFVDNSIKVSYQQSQGPVRQNTFTNNGNGWWGVNGFQTAFMQKLAQNAGNSPSQTSATSIITETISFVQYSSDSKGLRPAQIDPKDATKGYYSGYFENDGYYGQLGNLYLNFAVFVDALKNSSNKSVREVLMDILNEMSSAVNSFWNFQIVEQTDENGDIILKIVDENWSGKNNRTVRNFIHSGEKSTFLEANLSIDIPSEMTNQIILKRQDYISNPDSKNLDIGGIFSKKTDKFFKGVDYLKSKAVQQSGGNNTQPSNPVSANAQVTSLKTQIDAIVAKSKPKQLKLSWWQKAFISYGQAVGGKYETFVDPATGEDVFTKFTPSPQQALAVLAAPGLFKEYTPADTNEGRKFGKLLEDYELAVSTADQQNKTTITANLNKIDVVPNPEKFTVDPEALNIEVKGEAYFKEMFRIYACDDTQLFDIIKNNAFEDYLLKEASATSHPLPIKYSFKILGRSGIRRGDVFNVYGIPKKYRDFGFFQVVELEQTLSGNTWTTSVTGQFRQQKSQQ